MSEKMTNIDNLMFAAFDAQRTLYDISNELDKEHLHELAIIADDLHRRTEVLSAMLDRAHGINAAMRYLSGRRIYA